MVTVTVIVAAIAMTPIAVTVPESEAEINRRGYDHGGIVASRRRIIRGCAIIRWRRSAHRWRAIITRRTMADHDARQRQRWKG
jgi:hypothetical protein